MRGHTPSRSGPRSRPPVLRTVLAAGAAAALLPVLAVTQPASADASHRPATLQQAFATAAHQYHVPSSVLLAVSYLESRWDTHNGRPSVSGGYGPMHLTDARTALAQSRARTAPSAESDPRGDAARPVKTTATGPARAAALPRTAALPAALRTAVRAAALTGLPEDRIRTDPAANVAAGAALLADDQRALGRPLSSDPADWYGAVARYAGSDSPSAAASFADGVFRTLRTGQSRTTDDGRRVTLPAQPGLSPRASQAAALRGPAAGQSDTECPSTVACSWVPAPYAQYGPEPGDYGNHDLADRPKDASIDTIVIHDTEETWDDTLGLVQDPTYLGWHYTVRSSDGAIAQHMATKDVGWHAGNWYVNAKSIGIENEGFLADPDAWFTESMYESSARLVRYLTNRYHIPVDRQHIIGHDNVPGTTPSTVAGMHTDPGPYWDWAHYFELIGAPLRATARSGSQIVTIDPSYRGNKPVFTGCVTAGEPCAAHGSSALELRTAPSGTAPLVEDIGLHPTGGTTEDVNDTGARASTGQQYAVADRRGDWTAIWYLGQKAWFRNPRSAPSALDSRGTLVTPRPGLASIPVYGRAYPEASAYPPGVPVQAQTPLQYTLPAGQAYVSGGRTAGEYFYSTAFDTSDQVWVRGTQQYFVIQFGGRIAYVKASDVTVRKAGAPRHAAGSAGRDT